MKVPEEKKRNAKGQGCFVEMEDGTILYRKGVGYTPEGKRKTLTVRAKSKSACIQRMKTKEAEWYKELKRTEIGQTNTVEELCTRHLDFQVKNNELKPKSIDRREDTIKNQIGKYMLGHMQVQAVTPADIEGHIGELSKAGLSTSSVKKRWMS